MHRMDIQAFPAEINGKLVRSDDKGIVPLGNFQCVADMVIMAVRQQDDVRSDILCF